jgi:hypothetical protein
MASSNCSCADKLQSFFAIEANTDPVLSSKMIKSGSQGAKEASLYVSLLVLYSNVGHKITGHFSVATFAHRNRYPLAMYNQNITLSLFLSNLFYQGKK